MQLKIVIGTNKIGGGYQRIEAFYVYGVSRLIRVNVKVTLGLCVKNSEKIVKIALDSVVK